MSWIRMESQVGTYSGKQQYDGICELLTDLTSESSNGYALCNGSKFILAPGSMAICAEDKKRHIKLSDGSWTGTTNAQAASSG